MCPYPVSLLVYVVLNRGLCSVLGLRVENMAVAVLPG